MMIREAVKAAFAIIKQQGFDLRNACENVNTNELERVLASVIWNREIVESFDRRFFGKVSRGSEVEDYSGVKISKQPVLRFALQRGEISWDSPAGRGLCRMQASGPAKFMIFWSRDGKKNLYLGMASLASTDFS